MLRDIRTHETDSLNRDISILVLDDPDPVTRASHSYSIAVPGQKSTLIRFQHGNPAVEVNGLTNEALLAIMADRLAAFQTGKFACQENAQMLTHIESALSACRARTQRMGTEVRSTHLSGTVQIEMPKYRCHKEVWALKIGGITYDRPPIEGEQRGSATITPADADYAPFDVDEAWAMKHRPQVGGFYVVYGDGYASFSPAKAFEEGYTRIQSQFQVGALDAH